MSDILNKYEVKKRAGRYEIKFLHGVTFVADRIRIHSDGRGTCRLRVFVEEIPGRKELYHGQFNFSGPKARSELVKHLEKAHPEPDALSWSKVVEILCREILSHEESGEPIAELPFGEITEPTYVLPPLIIEKNIVVWYAPGGSGKSLIAMYAAILIHNGLKELWPGLKKGNVLYLDWETDRETASRRARLLAWPLVDKLEKEIRLPYYRRCVLPLAEDVSDIATGVAEHNIKVVFVDSAGPACGGDIESAETALRFFSALRQIIAENDASAVVLTHVTKAERRNEGGKLPIGSIYFENIPRATWQLEMLKSSEVEMLLGMFNRKANDSPPMLPMGFRVEFSDGSISVETTEVEDVGTEEKTQQEMISEFLKDGPRMLADIADYLGVSKSHACHVLRRMKQKGMVMQVARGMWGLVRKKEAKEGGDQSPVSFD